MTSTSLGQLDSTETVGRQLRAMIGRTTKGGDVERREVERALRVRGFLNWHGAWVEGGILTGKILDRIMDDLPGRVGTINSTITNSLSGLASLNFVPLYYLLGTGRGSTGHTDDDVSIVLVKRFEAVLETYTKSLKRNSMARTTTA